MAEQPISGATGLGTSAAKEDNSDAFRNADIPCMCEQRIVHMLRDQGLHDALMKEIKERDMSKKDLRETGPPTSAWKEQIKNESWLPGCWLPSDKPKHSSDSSSSDSDSDDSDWSDDDDGEKVKNVKSVEERVEDDHALYEDALLRSLMLFDDLDDEFDDEIFMNLDVLGLDNNRVNIKKKAAPNYPHGPEIVDECLVCFETIKLRKRLCCDFPVCDDCMEKYLLSQVERGVVKIECLNGTCDSYVHRDEILGRLPLTMKEKYYRFLVDANKDPNIKTCPRCSHIYNRTESGVLEIHGKYGVMVECPDCKLTWCFDCQAPWHESIKCKDFRKGDNLLKSWAKEQHFGHQNAQRCPRCKIYIERKGGCDHMQCTKCNTSFCYRCGDRYVDLKFFGNHLSRLSPLGCKYNYKPDEPVKRRLVRGSLLGVKLLGGVCLVGLGIAAGALLVGASVVILPVLGGYKYRQYRRIRKRQRQQQKLYSLRTRRAMMEILREKSVAEFGTERYRTWPRQEQRDGPVHIGIQTGPSQQADVTVHKPYHPDDLRDNADLYSEITMDIKDDLGNYTRTTAELKPGGSKDDEGDFVLHVKTQSANPPKENPDVVKDSERVDERETDLEASGKSSAHGSLSSKSGSSLSSKKTGANSKSKVKRSRRSSGSKTEKQDTKTSENEHSNETGLLTPPLPDLGLTRSLHSSQKEEEEQLGDADLTHPVSHSETGCFMNLFSKRLSNAEKEKQSIPKAGILKENDQDFQKIDIKEKDFSACPDVVSCTLQAALKTQESDQFKDKPDYSTQSSCSSNELDSSDCFEQDPYLGMISTESYHTFL